MGKKLSAYNLYMRKALKGKMAGKTKAQRKEIFKAAARGWNKGKPKSTSRSKPKSGGSSRSSSTTRRSKTTMGKFNTQKLYKLIRLAALVAPAAYHAVRPGTPEYKARNIIMRYTGFDLNDGQFRGQYLLEGYGPLLGATLATYGLPKLAGFLKGL
ncbi:unnamed protein product [marine sediment metagenome]|uniref:Uncharacterized protein n=1 Tax=marine sediment metagenome TaxID=412755 RepID=X0YLC6_9ZZZZ